MRPPKRAYTTTPGPAVPELAGRQHVEFNDPEAEHNPLPTYPYHMAPKGLATKRQLRKDGLSPRGEIQAQIVWWHGGTRYRNGRLGRTRRTAYLFKISAAVPVRPMTGPMWALSPRHDGRPHDLPYLRQHQAVLHPQVPGRVQRLPRPREERSMSKPRIIKPTHIIAASVIAVLIGIALIFCAAVAAHAAALSTGVGAGAEPVCSSAPLQPGHSYPL